MREGLALWVVLVGFGSGSLLANSEAATLADPREVLSRAKAQASGIPQQADALALLAWPADPDHDPRVAAAARQELIEFGEHGLSALREAVRRVEPHFQADVTAALIDSRYAIGAGTPAGYLPTLDLALWFGSTEARRLAMYELARYGYPGSMLTIIDAIYEDPELALPGIRCLGRLQLDQARYFLDDVLQKGPPRLQRAAAEALAQIGDEGRSTLRVAARSEDGRIREAAMVGLTPIAGIDDLTALHEFLSAPPTGDPEIVRRVREKAVELEEIGERQPPGEEADPVPNP